MSDVGWLDEEQQRAWRGWVKSCGRVHASLERSLRASTGLTMDDYEVLTNLSESEETRMRLSELASVVIQSPSRLSQRIDRMERDGLVKRQRSTEDGRVFYAVLTDKGMEVLVNAAPGHVEAVRQVLIDRLSRQEVRFLAELLPRLAEDIRAAEQLEC